MIYTLQYSVKDNVLFSETMCASVCTYMVSCFYSSQCTISAVTCPALVNGSNTEPVNNSSPYVYQDTYTYICTDGYEYSGDLVTTCTAAGTWSLSPPSCNGMFLTKRNTQH